MSIFHKMHKAYNIDMNEMSLFTGFFKHTYARSIHVFEPISVHTFCAYMLNFMKKGVIDRQDTSQDTTSTLFLI